MNLKSKEVKKFLKEESKKIILFTIILSLIFAFVFLNIRKNKDSKQTTPGINDEEEITNLSLMKFYIEKVDGNAYTNLALMREYLLSQDVFKSLLSEMPENYKTYIKDFISEKILEDDKEQEASIRYDNNQLVKYIPVAINIDTNAHVYSIQVYFDREEVNDYIINFYYDMLFNKKINFLENKDIYSIKEPISLSHEDLDMLETSDRDAKKTNNGLNIKNLIAIGFTSIVMGFLVAIFIVYIRNLNSKRIKYSFSYNIRDIDDFLLYNYENDNELKQYLQVPAQDEKYVLSERPLSNRLKNIFEFEGVGFSPEKDVHLVNVTDASQIKYSKGLNDIFIIVLVGYTTREWLDKQRELLSLAEKIPAKIIQINDEKRSRLD